MFKNILLKYHIYKQILSTCSLTIYIFFRRAVSKISTYFLKLTCNKYYQNTSIVQMKIVIFIIVRLKHF